MVNNRLGPGMRTMTTAATTKASRWGVDGTGLVCRAHIPEVMSQVVQAVLPKGQDGELRAVAAHAGAIPLLTRHTGIRLDVACAAAASSPATTSGSARR